MRSLADYEGSSYLPAGWHEVTVIGFEVREINSKPVVEFTLQDTRDRMVKKVFYLTDEALKAGFLARFAVDCGLTEPERRAYDVDNGRSHGVLLGKRLQVEVYKREGKYSDVDDNWAPIGEDLADRPIPPAVDRSRSAETQAAADAADSEAPF